MAAKRPKREAEEITVGSQVSIRSKVHYVAPGDVITTDIGFMRYLTSSQNDNYNVIIVSFQGTWNLFI